MPSIQAIADALSTTFADERYPLGTTYVQTDAEVKNGVSNVDDTLDFALLQGERVWIFVQADSSGVAAGDLVKANTAGSPFVATTDAADKTKVPLLLGVADNAIAASQYGWVIARGACVVKAHTDVTAGEIVMSYGSTGDAGEVADLTTVGSLAAGDGGAFVGVALEDEAGTKADYVQAIINVL